MFDILSKGIIAAQIRRQDGQAMVEYGLILGLVSVVAVVVLTTVGTDTRAIFTSIAGSLAAAV